MFLDESDILKRVVDGVEVKVELNDVNFVSEVNEQFNNANFCSYYCNEIFLYFYLKYKEWTFLKNREGVNDLQEITNSSYKRLWADFVNNHKSSNSKKALMLAFGHCLLMVVSVFAMLFLYMSLFLFIPYKKIREGNVRFDGDALVVIRSPAALDKVKSYAKYKNISIFTEGILYGNDSYSSLFSLITFIDILKILFLLPKFVFSQVKRLYLDYKTILPECSFSSLLFYYRYRILASSLYYYLLRFSIVNNDIKVLYTSNKEDRYALIESDLVAEFGIGFICIPHGLEYGLKLPVEPVGNVFYTTSELSSRLLNKLYCSDKFIFDHEVASFMFSKNNDLGKMKVVFFTEARGTSVNKKIMSVLQGFGFEFYVKLHPKDSKTNYNEFQIDYIDDYDFAVSNSICICRKSTVLLGGIYNNSTSIAFLIDDSDKFYVRYVFPSLSNESIYSVYTSSELYKCIINNFNKESDINVQ